MRCPGGEEMLEYSNAQPCSWRRKMCVTCSEEDGEVYIRVQSNSLPNHCFNSFEHNPKEIETDWKVKFNPDVTGQTYYPDAEKNLDTSLGIEGCATGQDTDELAEKKRFTLTIMIDGTRSDTVIAASTPAFDSMMKNGLWTMEAMTHDSMFTDSGPGWRSILTGVKPQKHGNFDNNLFLTVDSDYKSFLWHGHVEHGLKTLVMLNLPHYYDDDFLPALFESDSTD